MSVCATVPSHDLLSPTGEQTATSNVGAIAIVHRKGEKNFCSGTVLSERMVLTALHCVQDLGADAPHPPSAFRVGFGEATFDANVHWVGVSDVLTPSAAYLNEVEDLQGADVAVLMLQAPFDGTPFALPQQAPQPEIGSELTIVGFGEDRYGLVRRRHHAIVTVTGHTPRGFTFVGGGCLGDSGGPILDGEGQQLVGIVSIGTSRHCAPNFTRIGQPLAPFADFLIDQLLRGGQNN